MKLNWFHYLFIFFSEIHLLQLRNRNKVLRLVWRCNKLTKASDSWLTLHSAAVSPWSFALPRFHFLRSELLRSESVQGANEKSLQFTQHLNYSRDTAGLLGASDERLALQNMHNVCTSTQLHWHAAAPEEEVCWGFSLFVATVQSARAASLPVAPFWCQPAAVCQRLKQAGCVGWSRKGWMLGDRGESGRKAG